MTPRLTCYYLNTVLKYLHTKTQYLILTRLFVILIRISIQTRKAVNFPKVIPESTLKERNEKKKNQ